MLIISVFMTQLLMHAFLFGFTDTHVLISTCHLAFTWPLVREFLTPLNLHVQILKLELKWSPLPKIKLTSQSSPSVPDSSY